MSHRLSILRAFFAAIFIICLMSCTLTDGTQLAEDATLGHTTCDSDSECEPFGYCDSESGQCTADCYDHADCWLMDPAFICVHYRCVEDLCAQKDCSGEHMSGCELEEDEAVCTCEEGYHNESGACVVDEVCKDNSCTKENRGVCSIVDGLIVCGCDNGYIEADGECVPGEDTCLPEVIDDSECTYFTPEECALHDWPSNCEVRDCVDYGWDHTCNTDGKCVKNCELDLGEVEPESNLADYVGVWGAVFSTAVRNTGLPLVPYQDTVSIHHTLARISEEDGRLRIQHKLCSLRLHNFKGDKIFYEDLAYMVTPELYTRSCGLIEQYVDEPPALEAGATFDTTRHVEVRGTNLNDYTCDEQTMECNEAIPSTDDYLAGDDRIWDQDYDGNPGMTTRMTGVLNGEIYSDQRWSTLWSAEVVDQNKMIGLHHHTNEQYNLDSDNPSLLYNLETVIHDDADRSYWRYLRMADDTTCEDVLKYIEDDTGDWLSFTIRMDPDYVPVEE